MSRRQLRDKIFKLLFRIEFNETNDMGEQIQLFFEDEENISDEKSTEYINQKYDKVIEHLSEIDEAINQKAEGWNTSRMGKVDLTILRLAVYEIQFDEDVPTSVAINEAVELAKKYGQDNSKAFVNGVLAKFA